MSILRGVVPVLLLLVLWPEPAGGTLSAHDIVALAQQQLMVPSEMALGQMSVYRGGSAAPSLFFRAGPALGT
jgi:hypothetical protein